MKKFLVMAVLCAAVCSVRAEKTPMAETPEQKEVLKQLLAKYDTNKDGKLEKDERAKFSKEDRKKWQQAFGKQKKKGGNGAEAVSGATGDSKPATIPSGAN